jgi:hypothetical protein
MNMPGFNAESAFGPTMGIYRGKAVCGRFPSEGGGGVMPQLRFQSDPDLGAVDVTEEFPFLVTKLSPYYDR